MCPAPSSWSLNNETPTVSRVADTEGVVCPPQLRQAGSFRPDTDAPAHVGTCRRSSSTCTWFDDGQEASEVHAAPMRCDRTSNTAEDPTASVLWAARRESKALCFATVLFLLRTRLGDRSFSVAGPCLWNSLPVALRDRDISLVHCSLRYFWRHFGLCSAAAHSDCCFFAPRTHILTYLLTYLFTRTLIFQTIEKLPVKHIRGWILGLA